VSEVVNDLRALQIDDRISERYVLSKLRYYLGLFLKRENDALRLFYYDNVWTTVECLEMEEASMSECLGTTNCKVSRIMRSVKPIPELYSYKNGLLVKEVMSVDEGHSYKPSSANDFNKVMKRDFPGDLRYFWFRNGHLMILDGPDVVLFSGCFVEQSAALSLCSCNPMTCIDIMEDEFPAPAHLVSAVKQETTKDLFNFYKRVIVTSPDKNPTNAS